MTKIVSTPNCGNSPKMELLTQFNIAFAKADIKFLTEHVTRVRSRTFFEQHSNLAYSKRSQNLFILATS